MANEEIKGTGAVFYTDGSANPNPGFTGSGVHGYTYVFPTEKLKASKIGNWTATDIGYVLQKELEKTDAKPVHVLNYYETTVSGDGNMMLTNNIAELKAAITVFKDMLPSIEVEALTIVADSEYVLNGMRNRLYKNRSNYDQFGKPVPNKEYWEELIPLAQAFEAKAKLTLRWVRGHNDDFGNVRADWLAAIGTNRSSKGWVGIDQSVYHRTEFGKTVDYDLHPLFGMKRIYFNTDPSVHTPGTYYQTGWSGQDYITGKRTPEAAFSVIQLEQPDPIVETVIKAQHENSRGVDAIVYARIERLKSLDVYSMIEKYGAATISPDPRNINMNFVDKKPITHGVVASELPLRTIEVLIHLEELLEKFKKEYLQTGQLEAGPYNIRLHDVTEHFYERGTKKRGKETFDIWTLKKEFGVGSTLTRISVKEPYQGEMKEVSLPLLFQDDIPARNTMKKLEVDLKGVFVITWRESEKLLRYATIIQSGNNMGIWCNYFANQLFFVI